MGAEHKGNGHVAGRRLGRLVGQRLSAFPVTRANVAVQGSHLTEEKNMVR